MSQDQCDEALGLLYKLDLEHPNRVSIRRVLAWTLMKAGKLEQSHRQYEQLLEMDKPQGADYLNAGYCAWFQNRITDSISLFRKYIAFLSDDEKKDFFFQIQREIKTLGVSKSAAEIHLMIDLCRRDTNN
jgi:tetratricopeptide (TPR) repeat protein